MKTKKYYIKTIMIIVGLLSLVACDSFLEEDNFSRIPENIFYQDLDQAEVALLGVYSLMGESGHGIGSGFGNSGTWWRGMEWMTQCNTDECVIQTNGASGVAWTPLSTFSFTPDNIQIGSTWVGMFEGVYRANLVIQGTERANTEGTPDDLIRKNNILAEARFMRGFYYYYLMSFYGGVPLLDSPSNENTLSRNSVQEIAEFIEQDWLFALENMSKDKMDNQGRAGKLVAAAYLAKLNLYLASSAENNVNNGIEDFPLNSFDWVNQNERYANVATYTDMVYGQYTLIDDYQLLFMKTGEPESRNEFIFNVEFSAVRFFRGQRAFLARGNPSAGGGNGHLRPNHQMFDQLDAGDERIKYLQGNQLQRGGNVEVINGVQFRPYPPVTSTTANNRFYIAKWRKPALDLGESPELDRFTSDFNMPLIRYADVLLMRAEAYYKTTGSRTGVPDDMLTEVRARSAEGTDVATLNTIYNKADFMEELMEERSRELCFEGQRRFDLFRTNTYASKIAAIDPVKTAPNLRGRLGEVQNNFTPYKMWYPIPSRELFLSPNFVQNPGYPTTN